MKTEIMTFVTRPDQASFISSGISLDGFGRRRYGVCGRIFWLWWSEMAPRSREQRIDIEIPEGVTIKLSALQGAESLALSSLLQWSDSLPRAHRMDTKRLICRNRRTLLRALGVAQNE
jgi:hypothetical protein